VLKTPTFDGSSCCLANCFFSPSLAREDFKVFSLPILRHLGWLFKCFDHFPCEASVFMLFHLRSTSLFSVLCSRVNCF